MKKIFIIGKTSNIQICDANEKFKIANAMLEEKFEVFNPFFCIDGFEYLPRDKKLMKMLELLLQCECVFVMENYKDDAKAIILHYISQQYGKQIIYE